MKFNNLNFGLRYWFPLLPVVSFSIFFFIFYFLQIAIIKKTFNNLWGTKGGEKSFLCSWGHCSWEKSHSWWEQQHRNTSVCLPVCVRLTSLGKNTDKKNGGGQSIRNTQDIFLLYFYFFSSESAATSALLLISFAAAAVQSSRQRLRELFRALMETTKIEKVIKKAAASWRSARWTVRLTVEVSAIQPQRRVVQLTRAHAVHRPVPPPLVWIYLH